MYYKKNDLINIISEAISTALLLESAQDKRV